MPCNIFQRGPNGEPIECAGFFGNACAFDVTPEYRHRALVGWDTPWGFQTSLTWRHYDSSDNINGEDAADVDRKLDSVNYFDLAVNFTVGESMNIRAGVLNMLDEEPPVSVSSGPPLGNGNTIPSIFDTGRYFFLGANYTFN